MNPSNARSGQRRNPEGGSCSELINRLSRDVVDESCVLFVGAGCTTERWRGAPSFYSTIKGMMGRGDDCEPLNFPDLMQMFCDERDGGHHHLLVREAINYLEPFLLPGPANHSANELCALAASIPSLKTFVTTNWDPVLERALDVLVPITEDRDLAFWDDSQETSSETARVYNSTALDRCDAKGLRNLYCRQPAAFQQSQRPYGDQDVSFYWV